MRWLKLGPGEVITAAGLVGIIRLYLALRHDPLIVNPTLVAGELIALYAVTAVASEAMIVSNFRPVFWQVLVVNIVVAVIICGVAGSNVGVRVGIAVLTAVLRTATGAVSLHTSEVSVRRFTSAFVGAPLLLASAWTGFNLGEQAYYDYYLFPKLKEAYIPPTRLQDIMAVAVLWTGIACLFYISYRLLKYAFRGQNVRNPA